MATTLTDRLDGVCAVRAATGSDLVDGVSPDVVALPSSTEETSALLRACHDQDLAVVVRGHGSKLAWGRPPERLDVLLDTTGMDRLVEHARGDLIATAGAGMPLARLQEQLAEGGHQLAVDDLLAGGSGPGSTLGGAVATNLAGPRRMWAGAMRDLVIGVRLVRADGTVAKAGGKVVKNVAGYDLSKLLCGSYGTLAVVTEVTVRLHPLPAASHHVTARVPLGRLAEVLATVRGSQLVPRALEVHAEPGSEPAVGVLVSGTTEGTAARAEILGGMLGNADVRDAAPSWWGRLPDAAGGAEGDHAHLSRRRVLVRTTARLSGIPELVEAATGVGATVTGSAGAGVLYAALPVAAGDQQDPGDLRASVERLRARSVALGGSTVVLDAPAAVKAALDSWGHVPGLELMRRVKDEFDPGRSLAPGRFVGGL